MLQDCIRIGGKYFKMLSGYNSLSWCSSTSSIKSKVETPLIFLGCSAVTIDDLKMWVIYGFRVF